MHIARSLIARGHAVSVLARSPEKAARVFPAGGVARPTRRRADARSECSRHAHRNRQRLRRGRRAHPLHLEPFDDSGVPRSRPRPRQPGARERERLRARQSAGRTRGACTASSRRADRNRLPERSDWAGRSRQKRSRARLSRIPDDHARDERRPRLRRRARSRPLVRTPPRRGEARALRGGRAVPNLGELVATLEPLLGRAIPRLRAPAWLLRGAGSALDLVRRVRPISSLISREAMEYATGIRAIPNDPVLGELGVTLRPLTETYRDTLAWIEASRRTRRTGASSQVRGRSPNCDAHHTSK